MKIKNKHKKTGSTLIFVIFFLIIFLAFAAFAVDGTITLTNRAKLQSITEETALAAASEISQANLIAQTTFNYLKQDGLKTATVNVVTSSNRVNITSQYLSQPFFLAFLGVSGINLEAKSAAVSEPLPITANYTGINWLTSSAAYLSDILSEDVNLNDTAILTPIGNFASKSFDETSSGIIFNRISSGDSSPLHLGPGGFITIKLPAPIINKTGNDLYIKESGDAIEGYMVFAGIDKDPSKPYVNASNPGGGISWINISSSGTSEYSALGSNAHQSANTKLSTNIQSKFYGSGYFDIGKSNLSMAKYIRIIDDNHESAFYKNASTGNYYKAKIFGEASTSTPGADIGSVQVLNYVRLVPSS